MLKNLVKGLLPDFLFLRLLHLYKLYLKKTYLGMTSRYEQEYFEHYVRKIYSSRGQIVDLGSWLGSTTLPLAKGLSKRHSSVRKEMRVHAYDRFIWESWMDEYSSGCFYAWQAGESFLPEFRQRTRKFESYIEIHAGDLITMPWSGGDIEFLLIDAMKSWDLANSILENFYPSLIPGCSYVVHQDFKHYYCSWIHLLNYRFRDNFSLVYNIPKSAGVVVKYVKPIERGLLSAGYSVDSFSTQEIEAAFDHSLKIVSPPEQSIIIAAKAMCYFRGNNLEKAQQTIERYLARAASGSPCRHIRAVMGLLEGAQNPTI